MGHTYGREKLEFASASKRRRAAAQRVIVRDHQSPVSCFMTHSEYHKYMLNSIASWVA